MRSFLFIMLCVFLSIVSAQMQHQMVTRLEILPSNVTMSSGTNLRFTAIAYGHHGTAFTPTNLSWTADGGSIDQHGWYTAGGYAGYYQITVRSYGVSATAQVQIRQAGPTIARIDVTPDNSQVYPNNTIHFGAKAYDSFNRMIPCNFVWSTNGGTIDQSGLFQAGYTPGYYQVYARDTNSGIQGIANVRIVSGGSPFPPDPPQPYPQPTPYPTTGQIIITYFNIDTQLFSHSVEVTAQVIGANAQTLKLYAIGSANRQIEIDSQSCRHGQSVRLKGRYDSSSTRYFELRLFDNFGNEIARERRNK